MKRGIVGQNNIIHTILIISNNFQGVNFTMSKDEQTPEKEPKDRLSSHPSCCWYPHLSERLEDIVKLLQFSALLEKSEGCCSTYFSIWLLQHGANHHQLLRGKNPFSEIIQLQGGH